MQRNPVYRNHDGSVITIDPVCKQEIENVISAVIPPYDDNSQGGEGTWFNEITGEEESEIDDRY